MGLREDYQALMEKQLNEWKAQTEHFKVGAEKLEAHAKVQYEKNLEALHTAQTQAWDYFHKMKDANENAWGQFKANVDNAGKEVKDAVERMTNSAKR